MVGRRFDMTWQHTAEELFVRYRSERDARLQRRWQALWLLRQGTGLRKTAALIGVSYRTVQEWVSWYRQGGLVEVARHQRGGLRRQIREPLTPKQQAALVQQARTVGFATLAQAIAWVDQAFGVRLSVDQMRRQVARLALRLKVPRPRSDRADPAVQADWKRGASARH